MKKQQLVAVAISLLVVVWFIVPHNAEMVSEGTPEAPKTDIATSVAGRVSESPGVISVRAERIRPQSYTEQIRVRGRTKAFRHVEVRAEQPGRIVGNPVTRGARVKAGDLLCEIAIDNREADLREAISRREQAQFEYDAALDLQERGLQSDVIVSQLKAALELSLIHI